MEKSYKELIESFRTVTGGVVTESRPSDNESFGFYGTVNGDKKGHWDKAFKALKSHFPHKSDKHIRDFLDSTHGRHLADVYNDNASIDHIMKSPSYRRPIYKGMDEVSKAIKYTVTLPDNKQIIVRGVSEDEVKHRLKQRGLSAKSIEKYSVTKHSKVINSLKY